jgi:hypothetical protein
LNRSIHNESVRASDSNDTHIKSVNALRTRLHSKKVRKCSNCNQILVKPEPKASSTKFLIRYSAIDYFPVITKSQDLLLFNPSNSTMGISFLDTQLKSIKLEPGNSSNLSVHNIDKLEISCTTKDSILNFSIKI